MGSDGEGNGNPLQYSCLEDPVGGGAWWAAVCGVTQSQTRLKWLSMRACKWVPIFYLPALQRRDRKDPRGLEPGCNMRLQSTLQMGKLRSRAGRALLLRKLREDPGSGPKRALMLCGLLQEARPVITSPASPSHIPTARQDSPVADSLDSRCITSFEWVSLSVTSDSMQPAQIVVSQSRLSMGFPKKTGVGCHFLL